MTERRDLRGQGRAFERRLAHRKDGFGWGLVGANLTGANLEGANLTGARLH